MNERERLERVISDALTESLRDGRPVVACLADAVERVRLAAPAPAEPPVWPGLEGEGLYRLAQVWIAAHNEASERGLSYDDARRAAYTAEAAHLWRAMVASMPAYTSVGSDRLRVGDDGVYRTALVALADPYDGGTKEEG